jgi:hypothetical protein
MVQRRDELHPFFFVCNLAHTIQGPRENLLRDLLLLQNASFRSAGHLEMARFRPDPTTTEKPQP